MCAFQQALTKLGPGSRTSAPSPASSGRPCPLPPSLPSSSRQSVPSWTLCGAQAGDLRSSPCTCAQLPGSGPSSACSGSTPSPVPGTVTGAPRWALAQPQERPAVLGVRASCGTHCPGLGRPEAHTAAPNVRDNSGPRTAAWKIRRLCSCLLQGHNGAFMPFPSGPGKHFRPKKVLCVIAIVCHGCPPSATPPSCPGPAR